MSLSEGDVKDILCKFASGVCVITTSFEDNLYGFTATSFTSVSMDPPLILFCLSNKANSKIAFINNKNFAVNFLSNKQRDIAKSFATRSLNKFVDLNFHISNLGNPLIDNNIGVLECELRVSYDAGDHVIIIGEIVSGFIGTNDLPAIYYERDFREIEK